MVGQRSSYWPVAVLGAVLLSATVRVPAQPARARTLVYDAGRQEWREEPPPPPGTSEGDLYAIRILIGTGSYKKALSGVKGFVKRYGESDPQHAKVLLARSEALIGLREYFKAHEILQEFLGSYGGGSLVSEALRQEYVIAEAFLSGVKRKIGGVRLLSGEDLALRILDEISVDYPNSPLAELAIKTKADYLYRRGEHALADLEYARLLREHPQSRYHQFALRRSAETALASFAGVEYDQSALIEAEERYGDYRLRYPGAADREGVGLILDSIRERKSQKDLSIAAYYERIDRLASAIHCYKLVRRQWPDTIAATKATERLELLGALERVDDNDVSLKPREP